MNDDNAELRAEVERLRNQVDDLSQGMSTVVQTLIGLLTSVSNSHTKLFSGVTQHLAEVRRGLKTDEDEIRRTLDLIEDRERQG